MRRLHSAGLRRRENRRTSQSDMGQALRLRSGYAGASAMKRGPLPPGGMAKPTVPGGHDISHQTHALRRLPMRLVPHAQPLATILFSLLLSNSLELSLLLRLNACLLSTLFSQALSTHSNLSPLTPLSEILSSRLPLSLRHACCKTTIYPVFKSTFSCLVLLKHTPCCSRFLSAKSAQRALLLDCVASFLLCLRPNCRFAVIADTPPPPKQPVRPRCTSSFQMAIDTCC